MREKLGYLRDRVVNAFWMLRHGKWDLMTRSLVMELNLRRHNLIDILLRRRGLDFNKHPGSRYRNLRRVYPPSFRPYYQQRPGSQPQVVTEPALASEIQSILDSIDIEQCVDDVTQPDDNPVPDTTEYYQEERDRLLAIARQSPLLLTDVVRDNYFYKHGEYDNLYRILLQATTILCRSQDAFTAKGVLCDLAATLQTALGAIATHNFFSQLQLLLGLRRIRVCIYDHAGHFAGGGQRYLAEVAALIQDRYSVTYLFNNEVNLENFREWYDLDLSRCSVKVLPIPFFQERSVETPNESMVLGLRDNVFDIIARESLDYDVFINANMLGKVNPLSRLSVFFCHFPDKGRDRFFQVHKYDRLVVNGNYTAEWVRKRWQLEPTEKIYPPVSMYSPDSSPSDKELLILSVSRFEVSGSKKQLELVKTFRKLCHDHEEACRGWRLVLAGGATPNNNYLEMVRQEASASGCDIVVLANASVAEIRDLYRRAGMFWHACGLNESQPERVEHFGMTTVEAMQNYCVPIVIDGGGQREIVVQGESGYRFDSTGQLAKYSLELMRDLRLREQLAQGAFTRSQLFNHEEFTARVELLMDGIEDELLGFDGDERGLVE